MASGEFDLIRRFRSLLPEPPSDLVIGPGDDCAAIDAGDGRLWLLTCDAQVEGRHFPTGCSPDDGLGRRIAAVNLSDIAAMGGSPRFALLSLVVPDRLQGDGPDRSDRIEAMVAGVVSELGKYGAVLAGGNLSGGAELVADLTLMGEVPAQQVLRRTGARQGDSILVTGVPGASVAGRALIDDVNGAAVKERFSALVEAHNTPVPQVQAGRTIASSGMATAMIDVSDGLMADLGHLCEASGVGAKIELPAIDPNGPLQEAADLLGIDPGHWVLAGGEDYELLLTCRADSTSSLIDLVQERHQLRVNKIGTVQPACDGVRCKVKDGTEIDLSRRGWDHFRKG
jgi:thiamine-monophosphate kinase